MLNSVFRWLRNPVVHFIFFTFLALLLYFLSKDITSVSYAVSNTEVIAEKPQETPELVFHWKERLIEQELRRLKVAIWNSGNTHIDFAAISTTNQLRLGLSDDATIVSQKVTSKSRENLEVKTTLDSHNIGSILIDLVGDDALEINDGFVISIFYLGEEKPKIELQGRVKGMSVEFDKVDWGAIKSNIQDAPTGYVVILIVMLLTGILLYLFSEDFYKDRPVVSFILYKVVAIIGAIGYVGLAVSIALGYVQVIYYGLSWVK